ncbi:hypothetical protein TB2_033495 [Malus domestica]
MRICLREFWNEVTQGVWDRDSILLQLLHLTKELAKRYHESPSTKGEFLYMDTLDQISTLAMAPRKIYFHLDLAISQKILAMVDEGVTIPSPHQGVNNRMPEKFTQTTASTTTASPKSDEGRHNTRVNLPAPPVSATFFKTRLTEDSIFSLWTLETVDGICVAIKGFINEQNTIENGIPSEARRLERVFVCTNK